MTALGLHNIGDRSHYIRNHLLDTTARTAVVRETERERERKEKERMAKLET